MDKLPSYFLALAISAFTFGALALQTARFPCCFARVASHGRQCAPIAPPARVRLVSIGPGEVSGS